MTPSQLRHDVERYLVDPRERHDPYALYERLRQEEALRTRSGAVMFSRYADVRRVLTNDAFSVALTGIGVASADDLRTHMLSFTDPPDHIRLRRIVAPHFAPPCVEAHRHVIADIVRAMVPVAESAEFDVVSGLAHELPVDVTCAVLGLPSEEQPRIRAWTDALARQVHSLPSSRASGYSGWEVRQSGFAAYIVLLMSLTTVRTGPLGALQEAVTRQEIDAVQLVAYVMLLLVSGRETVTNAVSTAVLSLLRHPEQLQLLRSDPNLVPAAVEECIRYESPVHLVTRIVRNDVNVDGVAMERGQVALALIGAANRDETIIPDAGRFDITRPAVPHLGFGAGVHYCLGTALARVECQAVVAELFTTNRRISAPSDLSAPSWRDSLPFRGLAELNVQLSRS